MKYLGIDYGSVRTGVAVSDPDGRIAFPRKTFHRLSEKKLIGEIVRLIEEEGVEKVVIGVPLNLSGNYGAVTEKVKRLAKKIAGATKVEVIEWDERYTTTQVLTTMRKDGVKAWRSRNVNVIDQASAALILQSYLDYIPHT